MTPEEFIRLVDSMPERMNGLAAKLIEAAHADFVRNFDGQSFDGVRWPEVERNSGGWKNKYSKYSGNPPLVETGELKKALQDSIKGRTWADMRIVVEEDYASYQNDGTDKIPQRQFVGTTRRLEDELARITEVEIRNIFGE